MSLWTACFTQHNAFKVHPCCACNRLSFLRLNNILVLCIHCIFKIHLSSDRHLGWFHLLFIVTSAAMNVGMQISLQDPVFTFCFISWMNTQKWHCWIILCFYFLIFLRNLRCFHMHYFTFPLTVHRDSNLSAAVLTLVIPGGFVFSFFFFNSSHFIGCEVISQCGFDLNFSDD